MRPGSIARHTAGVAFEGLLILATVTVLLFAAAVVTRGEPGGADDAFAGRNGAITVADGSFAQTTVATANPGDDGTWVMAECFQNGTIVYRQYVRVDPATHQATLTLGPTPSWSSGAASCRAEEGVWFKGTRWRVLATTTFEVSG
ncbi:MAG: hypothetical protein HW391_492 [Chloroflexi bacterium]|nr:hypothetical protein [Chloroflexota bacterium]